LCLSVFCVFCGGYDLLSPELLFDVAYVSLRKIKFWNFEFCTLRIVGALLTMDHFLNWQNFQGKNSEKFFKNTLWTGEHVMLGLNCLEPNQQQSVHAHSGADKFYYVLSGKGRFVVGDEEKTVEAGTVVLAPASVPHGVTNIGSERLSLLVAIAPGINK